MPLKNEIKALVKKHFREFVEIRRYLHAHPELSFVEKNTSQFIKNKLNEAGIPFKEGFCKYGILAEIKGKAGGSTVYLRGDMDALPIQEKNNKPYKSKFDGIMHACGHDVHTTCVLSTALILHQLKDKIKGCVRIIFQPGEEKLPGGASIMIKDGVLKGCDNSPIIAQHVHPPLEAGKVGFHIGEYMASADELYFEVVGKGGHAALPKDCIDTILVASKVVSALHNVVSRYSNPQVPTVLSLGKIFSHGGATNIIPDKVEIWGTLRTMDEDNRLQLHKTIKQVVSHTVKAYGAKAKVNIKYGYPTLYNDEKLTQGLIEEAKAYLGAKNVVMLDKRMTAEDFAYFSQIMPACFYRLGTGNKAKGIVSPVHTPTFDIDESALKVGVGLMSYLALRNIGN